MTEDEYDDDCPHDPFLIDELAIARALQGDPVVWASLTPLERREAIVRTAQKRRAEQAENAEWGPLLRATGTTVKQYRDEPRILPHPTRHPEWLVEVAAAAGYANPDNLLTTARRFEKRDRET